jgi:hypothetical protein
MQVRIGMKQGDKYASEWTGDIAGEEEVGVAIGQAIADYQRTSGQAICRMTIMIDKATPTAKSLAICLGSGFLARFLHA